MMGIGAEPVRYDTGAPKPNFRPPRIRIVRLVRQPGQ